MGDPRSGVHVILDPQFGNRLQTLPLGEAAWVVDTEINRLACEALRKGRMVVGHIAELTTFRVNAAASPLEWLISVLPMIELHHAELSRDPPWSAINVIGTSWTERIQKELTSLGFYDYRNTPEGFVATKGG